MVGRRENRRRELNMARRFDPASHVKDFQQ
jgi:hypothetical protein